jgi:hypothetical protein
MPADTLNPPPEAQRFSKGIKPGQLVTGRALLKNAEFVDHSGKKVNKPTTVKIAAEPSKSKIAAPSVNNVNTEESDATYLNASADSSDDE